MVTQAVFRPSSATARTSGISSASIAHGASYTGSEIDNTTNRDALLSAEVVWSYTTAPTALKTVKFFVVYSQDGTNYEPADASNLVGAMSPPADTDTHRLLLLRDIPLQPKKFKIVVENTDTGQTINITVNAYTYNIQSEDS